MAAFVQHMRLQHGRANVLVTEQFLDDPDVVTGFKEVRGERMPECVAPGMLDHTGPADGLLDGLLQNRLVNMMPAFLFQSGRSTIDVLGERPTASASLSALRYLRSRASGKRTRPHPSARSFS
jgi:hypothetical protein